MKTLKTILVATLALVALISCNKESDLNQTAVEESLVTFSVNSGNTKASGSAQGDQTNDNSVNTLEFFIFNAEGAAAGVLDAYKKFTTADGLSNLEVKATTGAKNIYVVANSHRTDYWQGVVTLAEFKEQLSSLTAENNKDFSMVGSIDATLQATTSLSLAISRLVARVKLSGIKTTFAGTPYEGMTLSNVKLYLTNVHSSKLFYNGEISTPVILNNKALVAADANSCSMSGMLYDAVSNSIGDAGYSTAHYFYAYENLMDAESATDRFTRLVIQADLDGNTYYYPVNINREGYGYVASNGHKGVKRNTAYEINVDIRRPGSTNPDEPVVHGVMSCTVKVLDWSNTTTANPEF